MEERTETYGKRDAGGPYEGGAEIYLEQYPTKANSYDTHDLLASATLHSGLRVWVGKQLGETWKEHGLRGLWGSGWEANMLIRHRGRYTMVTLQDLTLFLWQKG